MPLSRCVASLLISILVVGISTGAGAQLQDRPELQARMESQRAQIQAREKTFLAPSAEDLGAFTGFLMQPDTGMARLMPREKYDGVLLIRGTGRTTSSLT